MFYTYNTANNDYISYNALLHFFWHFTLLIAFLLQYYTNKMRCDPPNGENMCFCPARKKNGKKIVFLQGLYGQFWPFVLLFIYFEGKRTKWRKEILFRRWDKDLLQRQSLVCRAIAEWPHQTSRKWYRNPRRWFDPIFRLYTGYVTNKNSVNDRDKGYNSEF